MVVSKSPRWHVKIADFGISKQRKDNVTTFYTMNRGTFGFTAPEILGLVPGLAQGSYTFAVDLWSLGTIVYVMTTLNAPFQTLADVCMYAMGTSKLPLEALEIRRLSPQAQSFIKRLLSVQPKERPSAIMAKEDPWMTIDLGFSSYRFATTTTTTTGSSTTRTSFVTEPSAVWSASDMTNTYVPPRKYKAIPIRGKEVDTSATRNNMHVIAEDADGDNATAPGEPSPGGDDSRHRARNRTAATTRQLRQLAPTTGIQRNQALAQSGYSSNGGTLLPGNLGQGRDDLLSRFSGAGSSKGQVYDSKQPLASNPSAVTSSHDLSVQGSNSKLVQPADFSPSVPVTSSSPLWPLFGSAPSASEETLLSLVYAKSAGSGHPIPEDTNMKSPTVPENEHYSPSHKLKIPGGKLLLFDLDNMVPERVWPSDYNPSLLDSMNHLM